MTARARIGVQKNVEMRGKISVSRNSSSTFHKWWINKARYGTTNAGLWSRQPVSGGKTQGVEGGVKGKAFEKKSRRPR